LYFVRSASLISRGFSAGFGASVVEASAIVQDQCRNRKRAADEDGKIGVQVHLKLSVPDMVYLSKNTTVIISSDLVQVSAQKHGRSIHVNKSTRFFIPKSHLPGHVLGCQNFSSLLKWNTFKLDLQQGIDVPLRGMFLILHLKRRLFFFI